MGVAAGIDQRPLFRKPVIERLFRCRRLHPIFIAARRAMVAEQGVNPWRSPEQRRPIVGHSLQLRRAQLRRGPQLDFCFSPLVLLNDVRWQRVEQPVVGVAHDDGNFQLAQAFDNLSWLWPWAATSPRQMMWATSCVPMCSSAVSSAVKLPCMSEIKTIRIILLNKPPMGGLVPYRCSTDRRRAATRCSAKRHWWRLCPYASNLTTAENFYMPRQSFSICRGVTPGSNPATENEAGLEPVKKPALRRAVDY